MKDINHNRVYLGLPRQGCQGALKLPGAGVTLFLMNAGVDSLHLSWLRENILHFIKKSAVFFISRRLEVLGVS
jgi:hypothetical protein